MTFDQHINVNSSIRIILFTASISVFIKDGVAGKSSLASMICTFNLHEIVKDRNVYFCAFCQSYSLAAGGDGDGVGS